MPVFMRGSLVIAAESFLVAHNIHIIRSVWNSLSDANAGVIRFVGVYLCFFGCLKGCKHTRPRQHLGTVHSWFCAAVELSL